MNDPYLITEKSIQEPPLSFFGKLKFLGPGFILSASIVGSGELIATTVLGAKAGFTALWVIILSCLVKVAVQLEFGKHAILTGESCMTAFNKLPGISFSKAKWSLWIVFLILLPKIIQVGGILGAAAVVLNMLFSGIPIQIWALIAAFLTALLIYQGNYNRVEVISLLMIALFTILTLTSLISLQFTKYHFTWAEVASGLGFHISSDLILFAIGAFGITGVASDEIIAYNYWCIEKGYAAYTGKFDDTPTWKQRAKGWINIMFLDATVSMVIYTTVTVSFYLLGAAILHKRQEIPLGNEVIETLALIYTQTLGVWVKNIYLIGAFFVLFSSLYAALAAWTRLLTDLFGHFGWIDFWNIKQRKKIADFLAWILPTIWAITYLFINLPVLMVLSGGIAGSILLFLVVFAAYDFKYRRKQVIQSSFIYTLAFWVSVLSILLVGIYGIVILFG
jgi:Mn2+/Fe2+ NRAMP family transporter